MIGVIKTNHQKNKANNKNKTKRMSKICRIASLLNAGINGVSEERRENKVEDIAEQITVKDFPKSKEGYQPIYVRGSLYPEQNKQQETILGHIIVKSLFRQEVGKCV